MGMIGAVFPIIPGWLFMMPGILMLASDVPFLARIVCRLEGRFPGLKKFMQRVRSVLARDGNSYPPCPPKL